MPSDRPLGTRQSNRGYERKWWLVVDPKDMLTHEVFEEEGAATHWADGVGCAVVEVVRVDAYGEVAEERDALREFVEGFAALETADDLRALIEKAHKLLDRLGGQ